MNRLVTRVRIRKERFMTPLANIGCIIIMCLWVLCTGVFLSVFDIRAIIALGGILGTSIPLTVFITYSIVKEQKIE